MPKKQASEIERLFNPCSAIAFRVSQDHTKRLPAIILGFDDEASGAVAYNALHQWAKNDELMIAIHNKKEYIDATLIHAGSHEAAVVSQLSFDEQDFLDFMREEPQDRRLTIGHCVNPIKSNSEIGNVASLPLVLFRYIVVAPRETPK